MGRAGRAHLAEAGAHKLPLREQRVQLDLVHHRLDSCLRQQVFHLLQVEVAHAKVTDQPLIYKGLHCPPAEAWALKLLA